MCVCDVRTCSETNTLIRCCRSVQAPCRLFLFSALQVSSVLHLQSLWGRFSWLVLGATAEGWWWWWCWNCVFYVIFLSNVEFHSKSLIYLFHFLTVGFSSCDPCEVINHLKGVAHQEVLRIESSSHNEVRLETWQSVSEWNSLKFAFGLQILSQPRLSLATTLKKGDEEINEFTEG